MAKYLDQDMVTRYVQLGAEIDKLQKKKDDMRLEIIEGIEGGLRCPKDGPYLLDLTYQDRKTLSWKDEWVTLAKEFLGKKWARRKKEIESNAPVNRVPMLLPKVNPDYESETDNVTSIKKGRGAA